MRCVFLGDLHYSDYPERAHAAARDRLFEAWFAQVSDVGADYVFAVGDTTNQGSMTEMQGLQAIAEKSGLPFVRVTGNHDCYTWPKSELAPFFLGDLDSDADAHLYTYFDAGSTRFVLADTARDRDRENFGGFVTDEQVRWLQAALADFDRQTHLHHVVVMGHHPLHATTRRSTEDMLQIANSADVAASLAALQAKVGLYFCGHNHNHSIFTAGNWHHVQTANPLDCRSFRLVTFSDAQTTVETRDFDLSDAALLADFETVRHNIPAGFTPQLFEDSYGEQSDRHFTIRYPAASALE